MVREHDDTLLLDLLEKGLELHNDRLRLARLDRSHSVEDGEAAEGAECLQTQCFFHGTDILDQDLLSLLKGDRNLTEFKHISVRDERLGHSRRSDL